MKPHALKASPRTTHPGKMILAQLTILAMGLFAPAAIHAQTSSTIDGNVSDAKGGMISHASVSVVNETNGRLTNLTQLSVDTSWYTRYRSATNPDFGAAFPQAIPVLASGHFSAIPQTDAEFASPDHAQVLANTPAFHFGFI